MHLTNAFSILQGVDVPTNLPQGQTVQCSGKLQKTPKASFQTLQNLGSQLNVGEYGETVRKRQNKYGLFGQVVERKPPLQKEYGSAT